MKLISFRHENGSPSWGIATEGEVVDCGGQAPSLKVALASGLNPQVSGKRVPLSAVTVLPPIPDPEKIICVGLNYLTHIQEGGRDVPKFPTVFTRWANTQVAHGGALVVPRQSETLDFEGELAVVVGRRARHVARAEAMGHVAGFSCYNDGSVREWQRHTSQFTPGKNFPGTGGFGPWMVTPDAMPPLGSCSLVTRVSGEEMQRATLDDLVFDVPSLIEYCSGFTVLEPGDVIITGTTGGVGAYRTPPRWLRPGDVVEVEITGIGTLRNTVQAEG